METVAIDREVLAGCRRLLTAGYKLAPDDFRWFDGPEQLISLASIVKLDVLNTGRDEIRHLVERCRAFGVQLLAEKVETVDDMTFCRSLGFDLFQGYVLQRPQTVSGAEVVSSQVGRIKLSALVLSHDVDLDEFEKLLEFEAGLVVALVRLASLGNKDGVRRQVRTTRDALVLLGTRNLRRWFPFYYCGILRTSQPTPSQLPWSGRECASCWPSVATCLRATWRSWPP